MFVSFITKTQTEQINGKSEFSLYRNLEEIKLKDVFDVETLGKAARWWYSDILEVCIKMVTYQYFESSLIGFWWR